MINFEEELKNFNEFDCPNCACEIHVHKNTLVTDCPLCGEHIEVLKQLELKKIKDLYTHFLEIIEKKTEKYFLVG